MDKPGKYQGLPFLATDDKDVYECGPDNPASNKPVVHPPDASIEIIPNATLETFQRFQNQFMQSGFSEVDIRPSRESAVSKYNRLREEIEDLKSQIDEESSDSTAVDIDISQLEVNLSNLKLLTTGKPSRPALSTTTLPSADDDRQAVIAAGKVNFLEQRIKKLENFLGSEKGSFLNGSLKDESLTSLVVQLSNKATVLDHSSLDKVDARLNVVLDKLEQIGQKKDDVESLTKLNELYEHYVKTADAGKRLPAILERLQVLNEVQRQASNFTGTIAEFQTVQKAIQDSLDATKNNLKTLKESLESKSDSIEAILQDYSRRIDGLK